MPIDSYNFPSKHLPEDQKQEEWYTQYILAIMSQTLGGGWFSLAISAMDENYNIYNNQDFSEEFEFLQESEDGKSLPALWMNFNKIRAKIHLMVGELVKRGFDVTVEAKNKDAQTAKMRAKARMMAKMRMKGVNKELSKISGVEIFEDTFIPDSLEELDTFFKSKWKSNHEVIMEAALRYNIEFHKWKYWRLHAFRDMMITGRCFAKCEIRNGYPNLRVIDPRYVVFDPYAKDDFVSDASYFGEVRYMTFEDAAEQYDVSKDELEELYVNSNKGLIKLYWQGVVSVGAGFQTFLPFTEINGGTRVLVFEAEWLDYKIVKYKESEDKYGNKHYKTVGENVTGDGIIEKTIATVRRGTLVGGHLLKQWGMAPNQTRDIDNPAVTRLSYVSLLPNYTNYRSISKLDEMKTIQKLKDIVMYRIQLEISTAGRKGFSYDVSLLPENMDIKQVMYYLKIAGITFYNSKAEGIPTNTNPIQQFDNSLTAAVTYYLEISNYLDKEMDEVSGISAARSGYQRGAQQLVGVTQAELVQSSLMTEPYFELFLQWEQRIFQKHADHIKLTWAHDKEKFSPIIGDVGVNMLEADSDVDLDDYAIFAEIRPEILENKARFQEIVMAALQSGNVDLRDALVLLMEKDTKVAIRKFLAISERKEKINAQQQQALLEQQAEIENQKQLRDLEGKLALVEAEGDNLVNKEVVKGNRDEVRQTLKSQHDMKKAELEKQTALLMEEIKRRGG